MSKVIKDKAKMDVKFISIDPVVTNPVIVADNHLDYVKFGTDNKYPNQLLDYFTNVGLHKSIILKKQNMMLGTGVSYEAKTTHKKTQDFIDTINPHSNINQILDKCSLDLLLFGGYYLQVIWSRDKKSIAEIYHMPFDRMRSGKLNEHGVVDEYFYNTKNTGFAKYTMATDLTTMPAFNIKENKEVPQILFIKKYDPTNLYYSLPDYSGSVTDINTLEEISTFQNANVKNNFNPGFIVVFRGPDPDDNSKDKIVKGLREKYSGSENAGKPAIFFLDTDQEAPQFEPMDVSHLADIFNNVLVNVKENIVVSHQVPRSVASIEQAGSLGNTKEVLMNNMIFRNDYIEPLQQVLLSGFNQIFEINKLKTLTIVNPNPSILSFGISELKDVLTTDEIREFLGYENLVLENDKKEE